MQVSDFIDYYGAMDMPARAEEAGLIEGAFLHKTRVRF
jgi:hypothetical protein